MIIIMREYIKMLSKISSGTNKTDDKQWCTNDEGCDKARSQIAQSQDRTVL
jgi:hypothetical protein